MQPLALPSFCKPIFAANDPLLDVSGIEFWAVKTSGDDETDRRRGVQYADEAIKYAQQIGQPEFVAIVILWITFHLEGRPYDPLELAFITHAMDVDGTRERVAMHISPRCPQLRQ